MAQQGSPVKPKQTVSSIDTDDLLEALEKGELPDDGQEPVKQEETPEINVLQFLEEFNIKPGEDKVKTYTLYSIYKVWSKNHTNKVEFIRFVNKLIPNNSNYFFINQNAIKLTHDAYSKFKQEKHQTKIRSKVRARHFEDFILYYGLEGSDFWIEAPILYFIYDKFAHEKGLDKTTRTHMSEPIFYTYANIYFRYKNTKYGKIYNVSSSILNKFQAGQYERMRKAHEKEFDEKDPQKSSKKRRTRKKVQPKTQS